MLSVGGEGGRVVLSFSHKVGLYYVLGLSVLCEYNT